MITFWEALRTANRAIYHKELYLKRFLKIIISSKDTEIIGEYNSDGNFCWYLSENGKIIPFVCMEPVKLSEERWFLNIIDGPDVKGE